jgi:hypothetical protein
MISKKLKNIIVTAAVCVMALPMMAHAQTSIEKAFVAKSKLHNSIWKKHDPSSSIVIDHSAWSSFLSKYTARNSQGITLVAYGRVGAADKTALKNYLAALQATDVTRLNRNEQYAFWLNLYNASVVNVVLNNKRVSSVLKIKSNPLDFKGPFNDPVATVNGKTLTPDTIESGIVRPIWNDPNLHYGFNCAALGCPNLQSTAFTGKNVNSLLADAARTYINDPRGITIRNGAIIASKIYFWYSEDFGGEKGVIRHVTQYASPALKEKLKGKTKIKAYEYDWRLNKSGASTGG